MALTTVRPQGMGFNTGRRNLIKNGAMLVSQRGTSFTSVVDNAYTLDRYRLTENSPAVVDISQSTDVPSEGGFTKSLKIDVTTSTTLATDKAFALLYKMEGYDFLPAGYGNSNANYLTLSFWVKSNVTGTYRLTFLARKSGTNRSIGATYTIDSADTWEKKEVTIIPDTASTPYQTTDEAFRIEWYLDSGPDRKTGSMPTSWATLDNATRVTGHGVALASSTDNEWYITGVQLELGENASDFEHRSFGEELALCRRYFEKSYDVGTTPGTSDYNGTENWAVNSEGNGNTIIRPSFNVEKRTAPTMVAYQATGTSGSWNYERSGASGTGTTTFDRKGTNGCRAYVPIGANFASAYIFGHWTADAEL